MDVYVGYAAGVFVWESIIYIKVCIRSVDLISRLGVMGSLFRSNCISLCS